MPRTAHRPSHRTGVETLLAVGALRRIPLPAIVLDVEGRIAWANEAAGELFGPVGSAHFTRLLAPEAVNEAREGFARLVMGVDEGGTQFTLLATRQGQVELELAWAPLRDGDGAIAGVLAIARRPAAPQAVATLPRPRLTPRQHDVLELLAEGLSTEEIAARLRIAEETTRNHVNLLLAELKVHTRLAAVVLAYRNGWVGRAS